MSLLDFLRRRGSAPVARERLQVLLAYERANRGYSDLLAVLREEIVAVIARHITIDRDCVAIKMDRGDTVSTLEIDIEIPHKAGALLVGT
ncbi:MAG: cell division topological specificity factor MinE [Xanthobacteraceae bacterium]|jgi:cell division topological specificity factor|nr:cell division topological specificity factor MinE [Xanthobacteraceae bacterium]